MFQSAAGLRRGAVQISLSEVGTRAGPSYDEGFYAFRNDRKDRRIPEQFSPFLAVENAKRPTLMRRVTPPGRSARQSHACNRWPSNVTAPETELVMFPREPTFFHEAKTRAGSLTAPSRGTTNS